MTNRDYTDDLKLLGNKQDETEFQLRTLEQADERTDLYVNTNKTKFMCL